MPRHKELYKPGAEATMRTYFYGKVDHRYLELVTIDYFHRIIAIFVVRMSFPVAESQSTLICLGTQYLATQSKVAYGNASYLTKESPCSREL